MCIITLLNDYDDFAMLQLECLFQNNPEYFIITIFLQTLLFVINFFIWKKIERGR